MAELDLSDNHIARSLADHSDADWHEPITIGKIIRRDSIGRPTSGSGWQWLEIRCNNPDCFFTAIIKLDVLAKLVDKEFK